MIVLDDLLFLSFYQIHFEWYKYKIVIGIYETFSSRDKYGAMQQINIRSTLTGVNL